MNKQFLFLDASINECELGIGSKTHQSLRWSSTSEMMEKMGYLDSVTVFVGSWLASEHTEDPGILTPGRGALVNHSLGRLVSSVDRAISVVC